MTGRIKLTSALFVVSCALLYQVGCGSSSPSPAAPTPPSGGGGNGASLVTIVGQNASQSFSPNPASVATGGTIDFRNGDSTTHHIVADDGSFDTGNLTPGVTSAAMSVGAGTVQYHCTIHPSMVGSVNGATNPGPTGPGY